MTEQVCKWCGEAIYKCIPEGKKQRWAHESTKIRHCGPNKYTEKRRHLAAPDPYVPPDEHRPISVGMKFGGANRANYDRNGDEIAPESPWRK